jgi:galactose mutarotase-like enzyme
VYVQEVTLCRGDLASLRTKSPYYGSTVGRVANRVAGGQFTVGGRVYSLATNNGPNSLHGGVVGFDKVLWTPTIFSKRECVLGTAHLPACCRYGRVCVVVNEPNPPLPPFPLQLAWWGCAFSTRPTTARRASRAP